MTVETYVERALDRIGDEREAVEAKRAAYAAFADRIDDIPVVSAPSATPQVTTVRTNVDAGAGTEGADRRRAVRRAFAETVRPHSVADVDGNEPLLATIRNEFTDAIAIALSPTAGTPFSAGTKRAILDTAEQRRTEATVLCRVLDRETAALRDAAEAVDGVVEWLVEADATPLSALGFDALSRRHRRLGDHRETCDELARSRQATFDRVTKAGIEAGIRHRDLIEYLYGEDPVDYPVLATAASLDAACADGQRAVRDHLVRRV